MPVTTAASEAQPGGKGAPNPPAIKGVWAPRDVITALSLACVLLAIGAELPNSAGGRQTRLPGAQIARSMMAESFGQPELMAESSNTSPMMAKSASRHAPKDTAAPTRQRASKTHKSRGGSSADDGVDSDGDETLSPGQSVLVRKGNVQLQADRELLPALAAKARAFVEALQGEDGGGDGGGYVVRSDTAVGWPEHPRGNGSNGLPTAPRMGGASITLELAVPATHFGATMAFLRGGGVSVAKGAGAGEQSDQSGLRSGLPGQWSADDLLAESESVEDLTGTYVDTAARSASLEGTHRALLALLDRTANTDGRTVRDVLEVQRELRRVQQQLEARKATLQHLRSSSSFSRIVLQLKQRPLPPAPKPGPDAAPEPAWDSALRRWQPSRTARDAVRVLLQGGLKLADGAIFVAIVAVPLCITVGVLMRCLARMGGSPGGSTAPCSVSKLDA